MNNNRIPQPHPGQPGQQLPTVEQVDANIQGVEMRLKIVQNRLDCLNTLTSTLTGCEGDDTRNVLGRPVVMAISDLAGSFVMEHQIEAQILQQQIDGLKQFRAQLASPIVRPIFGGPRSN